MPSENPDPDRYIKVTTKERTYYRRKRGLVKPAIINPSLQKNVSELSFCSPVAKRILNKLSPYTQRLILGRTQARLTARLMKQYSDTGQLALSVMKHMDLQPHHPLDTLSDCPYSSKQHNEHISLTVQPFPGSVKRLNKIVTDFYFEAILLYGHLDEGGQLYTEIQTSAPYAFIQEEMKSHFFHFILPDATTPFVLFLKLSTLEGKEMAAHGRHYGMKAVLVG